MRRHLKREEIGSSECGMQWEAVGFSGAESLAKRRADQNNIHNYIIVVNMARFETRNSKCEIRRETFHPAGTISAVAWGTPRRSPAARKTKSLAALDRKVATARLAKAKLQS